VNTSSRCPRGDAIIATEGYYDRLRDLRVPESYPRSMIDFLFARGENVSETARSFRTSRLTVTKWVQMFRMQGQQGVGDLSRPPYRCLPSRPLPTTCLPPFDRVVASAGPAQTPPTTSIKLKALKLWQCFQVAVVDWSVSPPLFSLPAQNRLGCEIKQPETVILGGCRLGARACPFFLALK
jgi:hypothetical protein